MIPRDYMTRQEEIIIHLGRYLGTEPNSKCMPFGMTQEGIAATLGMSRQHVSIEIKRLMEKSEVIYLEANVNGCNRKVKTYSLSVRGINRMNEVRELMEREKLMGPGNGVIDVDPEMRTPNLMMAKTRLETATRTFEHMMRDGDRTVIPSIMTTISEMIACMMKEVF